jgi:hypothetical protein
MSQIDEAGDLKSIVGRFVKDAFAKGFNKVAGDTNLGIRMAAGVEFRKLVKNFNTLYQQRLAQQGQKSSVVNFLEFMQTKFNYDATDVIKHALGGTEYARLISYSDRDPKTDFSADQYVKIFTQLVRDDLNRQDTHNRETSRRAILTSPETVEKVFISLNGDREIYAKMVEEVGKQDSRQTAVVELVRNTEYHDTLLKFLSALIFAFADGPQTNGRLSLDVIQDGVKSMSELFDLRALVSKVAAEYDRPPRFPERYLEEAAAVFVAVIHKYHLGE